MAFLKTLFSKQERNRLRQEKADAKAVAVLRNVPEVKEFINWYEESIAGKRDKDINFVQLGYEAHDRYWNLVNEYPDIARLTKHPIRIPASERYYSWLDDEGSWHNWNKDAMEEHYEKFVTQEKETPLYGDYSIWDIGPLGGGLNFPYASCAYLSYAHSEKWRWQEIMKIMKKLFD